MTNYEKYAGTPERFADFIEKLDREADCEDYLSRQFCRGDCGEEGEEMYCTEGNRMKCIMRWLKSPEQGK